MSYEITISETRTVTKTVGKEWAIVGEKEVAREESMYTRNQKDDEPRTRIESIHGYTPEIDKKVIEQREIFKQVVEEMDLPAVIKAINGL